MPSLVGSEMCIRDSLKILFICEEKICLLKTSKMHYKKWMEVLSTSKDGHMDRCRQKKIINMTRLKLQHVFNQPLQPALSVDSMHFQFSLTLKSWVLQQLSLIHI
eukprot:TRINITY_DN7027_c0_g1_i24.p1 TRINITY_DN7027_c0_g1~~TRINITY_DN7027_c0_g1_i24.p1  ORF type:complete len:105 (-),score=15.93 TRINITY_DN7027_c0_g1_i24:62-376(-)